MIERIKRIKPLGDRVLVERQELEERTSGGIIIPDNAKEKAQTGVVIAVGAGRRENGQLVPMLVKCGDMVYFGKYVGTEAGENHLILKEDDLLGVIEK